VAHSYVSPGYFETMRIQMVQGGGFKANERPGGPLTVVVDEAFARMAWPGENPIGKRVRNARAGAPWRTVVGVVATTRHEAEMTSSWFLPYYQDPLGASTEQVHLMMRSSTVVPMQTLREVVARIDPALAVYGMTTMEALDRDVTSQDRLGAIVSGVFAVFGLVLAGFSLYGLLSYSVELRTSEIGIRMALGASRHSIISLVMRQAALRLAAGTIVGITLALGANQLLRSVVDGLPWVNWQTLAGLTLLMTAVTAIAAALPAMRATRVDPMRSLRA
jgi:ABC-type antimicrobial peptide transport system permease subunit